MRCRWISASPVLLLAKKSHVFRVTEADRVRDAFDRFGSRLYAASGQVGAKPFQIPPFSSACSAMTISRTTRRFRTVPLRSRRSWETFRLISGISQVS